MRSLLGLALFLGAIAVTAYGGYSVMQAAGERGRGDGGKGPAERVFAVETGIIEKGTFAPRIEAYGEIRSWRTLELRANQGGRLVALSDQFRDGVRVAARDVLFRIDPEEYEAVVSDRRAGVAEAEADLSEAVQGVEVQQQELRATETQRDLRKTALTRREGLLQRGVATAAEVEEAEMAFAAAEQTVAARAQAMLAANIRIDRTRLKLDRAKIALSDAERALAQTIHTAPFDGIIGEVRAVLGALASPNEQLGVLIDPLALEAVFRVTNAQYARLLDEKGTLENTELLVQLDLDDVPLVIPGTIDRAAALIGSGETGRLVYARLSLDDGSVLRPGDFVSVSVTEPPLSDVAVLPAAAVTEDGALLLVGEDERLIERKVRILRRQGDEVIVANVPDGQPYVTARAPQLGSGIKVRSLNNADPGPSGPMISLAPERQQYLIDLVERDQRLSAAAKLRILGTLRSGAAPADLVAEIEAGAG
ncbi:MAG: HlyD family efflux transporter periplasmic adaptor subunit [Pseudomonadota bacterium]